jgi:hypothetical protein
VQKLRIGWEGDVFGLHGGIDRDPRQILACNTRSSLELPGGFTLAGCNRHHGSENKQTISCTHGAPNYIGNATTTAEIDALAARCAQPVIPPETAEEKQAKQNYRRALQDYRQ